MVGFVIIIMSVRLHNIYFIYFSHQLLTKYCESRLFLVGIPRHFTFGIEARDEGLDLNLGRRGVDVFYAVEAGCDDDFLSALDGVFSHVVNFGGTVPTTISSGKDAAAASYL
jgi:hypothetical protein